MSEIQSVLNVLCFDEDMSIMFVRHRERMDVGRMRKVVEVVVKGAAEIDRSIIILGSNLEMPVEFGSRGRQLKNKPS